MGDLNTYMYVPYCCLINIASSKKKKTGHIMSAQLKYTRMPNQKFPKIHTSLWGSSTSSTSAYTFSVPVYFMHAKISY